MNVSWWSIGFLAAITATVGTVAVWFIRAFDDDTVRHMKHIEHVDDLKHEIVLVAASHPEAIRTSRLDRHPFYFGAWLSFIGYAMCVFNGEPLTSNVTALGETTRITMASTFIIGSGIVLAASALGGELFGVRIKRSVKVHPTCDVLGDDVSLPYRVGSAGMAIVAVGAATYSWTSFHSTAASLGGWLTGCGVAGASAATIIAMYFRTRFFEKWDALLIAEAYARREGNDARR